MNLDEHPKLVFRQLCSAQSFDVFHGLKQLEHLVGVCKRTGISAKQTLKRPERTPLAPAVNQNIKCAPNIHNAQSGLTSKLSHSHRSLTPDTRPTE